MSSLDEDQKHAIIEAVTKLGPAEADADFVRAFYRNVPPADVLSRDPAQLAAAASSLWRLGAERTPGTPAIRVLPPGAGGTWPQTGVVQIVTDDMPLLVASVTSALAGMGLDVLTVIHPVIEVARSGARRSAGTGVKESMMHIEFEGDAGEERRSAMVALLESVLADVRAAVGAWPVLRDLVERMAVEAAAPATGIAAPDAAEAANFLRWLNDGNFVLLGYREYALDANGARIVPGSGKGVLQHDDVLAFDGLRNLTQAFPAVQAALQT